MTSTASAALLDVRTGYVYGMAEATARQEKQTTSWSSEEKVDNARVKVEQAALAKLLVEMEPMWKGVVEQYANRPALTAGS